MSGTTMLILLDTLQKELKIVFIIIHHNNYNLVTTYIKTKDHVSTQKRQVPLRQYYTKVWYWYNDLPLYFMNISIKNISTISTASTEIFQQHTTFTQKRLGIIEPILHQCQVWLMPIKNLWMLEWKIGFANIHCIN